MSTVIVGKVDIFDPRFAVRVIPVNCVGVMGKGLAKEAARRWPTVYAPYQAACDAGRMRPGDAFDFDEAPGVWLAATKDHWRRPSAGSWAIRCAESIALKALGFRATSYAVPALGCGLGGLPWDIYGRPITHALSQGPDNVTFYLSPPGDP